MARNYTPSKKRRTKPDEYFFDMLPKVVRVRMACATCTWDSAWVLDYYRKARKAYSETDGMERTLRMLDLADQRRAEEWWGDAPSPCATAQVKPLITSTHRSA